MARGRLVLFTLILTCHREEATHAPLPSDTVELPPPAPLEGVEPPIVYPTFDAGGRTEIAIPVVACAEISCCRTTRIFPPSTWKVKVTKELLALDNPVSQLRVYMSADAILLGPPGFGCRSVLESSGISLAILPVDQVSAEDIVGRPLDGELVRVESFSWYTSGYWPAGTIGTRVFPDALHDWLQGSFPDHPWARPNMFPTGPYPGELVSVDGLHASYVDPPGVAGIAAEQRNLKPNGDPIRGAVFQRGDPVKGYEMMQVLAVRLGAERDPLVDAIIADFDERMRAGRDYALLRAIPRCAEGSDVDEAEGPCRH